MKSFFELREEKTQLTVGDYTTKHFDICPSAVKLYSKIKDMTPMVHLVVENMMLHDLFFRLEKQAVAQGAIDEDDLEKADHFAEMIMDNAEQMGLEEEHSYIEDVHMAKFEELAGMDSEEDMSEKTLTPAELKKREEVAKAIKRENPNMPMGKKMAIATATAKKVAEESNQIDELSKGTLGKYIKLAGHDREQRMKSAEKLSNVGHNIKSHDADHAHKLFTKAGSELGKAANRKRGINKAVNKLVGEEVDLDESITRVSDAKLKFHAVNGVPHGSYSKKEIAAEHDRRKKTGGSEYNAVKPSMNESADMSKLKLLARAGLVDQNNVEKLMAAFKVMQAGKPLSQQQKDLVISSYGELASIVTGDSQIFQKAKKAVAEAMRFGD